ncbi:MAG: hypothetical protein AB8H86_03345 [Polyangiales bacterium]
MDGSLELDTPAALDAGMDAAVQDGAAQDTSADTNPTAADAGSDAGPGLPETLSLAGLFAEGVSGAYAPGVRSYDVRFPLWTDDADKARHILLPEGQSIDVRDADHWAFPVGTRIFKEFIVGGVPVETRLLWKRDEDFWVYVSYVFRADGRDADAAPEGAQNVLGTEHDVPTQAQCRGCHQGGGDFVLGIGAVQLEATLFAEWIGAGMLPAGAVSAEIPGDAIDEAALGYLHANCAHCHGDSHPVSRTRTLRLGIPVGLVDPTDAPAWQTSAGVRAFHNVEGSDVIMVPGNPDASQLFLRMGLRGDVQMPPLGTERVDEVGVAAVRAWIAR